MAQVRVIRWSRRAAGQVQEIGEHIQRDSPWQAQRIVKLLYRAPDDLRRFPLKGAIVPEFADPALRELSVYSWRLIYRVAGEATLDVVAVIHGRRLLRRSLLES